MKTADGAGRLAELVRDADVVVDSCRPDALEALGFGMDGLARLRPGIILASVSCYGFDGPFVGRGGWEQVAQAVTGICETQGRSLGTGRPELVSQLMCDFTTGYLAAYGVLLALGRRAREGDSRQVRTSLCRSSMFIQSQGLLSNFEAAPGTLTDDELAPRHVREEGIYVDIKSLGPVLVMSETPPRWDGPSPRLGSCEPTGCRDCRAPDGRGVEPHGESVTPRGAPVPRDRPPRCAGAGDA